MLADWALADKVLLVVLPVIIVGSAPASFQLLVVEVLEVRARVELWLEEALEVQVLNAL
jgi:hypothetical protein